MRSKWAKLSGKEETTDAPASHHFLTLKTCGVDWWWGLRSRWDNLLGLPFYPDSYPSSFWREDIIVVYHRIGDPPYGVDESLIKLESGFGSERNRKVLVFRVDWGYHLSSRIASVGGKAKFQVELDIDQLQPKPAGSTRKQYGCYQRNTAMMTISIVGI